MGNGYHRWSTPNLTPEEFRYSQGRLHQIAQLIVVGVSVVNFLRQVKTADGELFIKVRQLEEEIRARALAEEIAEQANQSKSDFLANMRT
jgi:hypothetical protein